jgi:hypothetical protein
VLHQLGGQHARAQQTINVSRERLQRIVRLISA